MSIEIRPGVAAVIPMGGTYAQPSVSPEVLPDGDSLIRALSWFGERASAAAPVYSGESRDLSEYRKILGEEIADALGKRERPSVDPVVMCVRRLAESAKAQAADPRATTSLLAANLVSFADQPNWIRRI